MIVTLSPQEMMTAAFVGVRRQVSAMANKRANWGVLQSTEDFAFDHHIIGAMAELAAAKAFNLFWPDNVGRVSGTDVGGLIETRCRRVGGSGLDLAMRAHDAKPDKPYLLIHANMPNFKMVGWIFGREASLGTLNSATGITFVPAKTPPLRPIEELKALIRQTEAA